MISVMILRKLFVFLMCTALCLGLLPSCTSPLFGKENDAKPRANSYYEFFDTVSTVFSYNGDAESDEEFSNNCKAVQTLFEKYHKLFDIYYEYSEVNNLKTINKHLLRIL